MRIEAVCPRIHVVSSACGCSLPARLASCPSSLQVPSSRLQTCPQTLELVAFIFLPLASGCPEGIVLNLQLFTIYIQWCLSKCRPGTSSLRCPASKKIKIKKNPQAQHIDSNETHLPVQVFYRHMHALIRPFPLPSLFPRIPPTPTLGWGSQTQTPSEAGKAI